MSDQNFTLNFKMSDQNTSKKRKWYAQCFK